jgi:hypothetical protein
MAMIRDADESEPLSCIYRRRGHYRGNLDCWAEESY